MTPRNSCRSRWMHLRATRMWMFLLSAVVLQSFMGNTVGNKGGDIYVIHNEEGNFSISFNGSHIFYYGNEDYYYENSTFDYALYETPATENFGNSASHLLQGPLPVFFSLLHLLRVLLQDIRM